MTVPRARVSVAINQTLAGKELISGSNGRMRSYSLHFTEVFLGFVSRV
jgi:hypothetical protein